jgi:hypothetical protein
MHGMVAFARTAKSNVMTAMIGARIARPALIADKNAKTFTGGSKAFARPVG